MNPPRIVAVSSFAGLEGAVEPWLAELAAAGVEALWLRERTLSDHRLLALAERCRRALPASVRLLVSARIDIALLAGADGVHLPASGLPAAPLRALAERQGRRLLLGRSTHTLDEVAAARAEGVDYVTFSPVFATPSKAEYGPPRGLAELAAAVRTGVPVIALGGLEAPHAPQLRAIGVAGIAAQRAFAAPQSARELVRAFAGRP